MREEIARLLLKVGAVTLRPSRPFVWASGIRAPIYCDNRLLLSHRKAREEVVRGFERLIRKGRIRYDLIAGVATAGLPHAAILADRLRKPLIYVRPDHKGHGKRNLIEGRVSRGTRALLIEDLVSTGASVLTAVRGLRAAGVAARHCLAIFSYGLSESQRAFERAHCQLYTLTNLETLLTVAVREGWITEEEKAVVARFSQDPRGWSRRVRGALKSSGR